eukprot:gene18274-24727_t
MFSEESSKAEFFEAARNQAQRDFEADETNAQPLVRWGGALLELAHYKQGQESIDMIMQAIEKLQQALRLDPERPDGEWCLGNAFTSLGFLCPDKKKALEQFQLAAESFKRCLTKEPTNDTYKKALEMCDKAPEYYDEIQAHLKAQSLSGGDPGKAGGASATGESVWWDVGGWVLLGAVIVGAMVIARNGAPNPTA